MVTAPGSLDSTDRRTSAQLARGFFALAGLTYCLIVLGALVRAHGAGLTCPDWPLCFGNLIPEFDFEVAFEWSHRALAGSVGILFSVLAVLSLWRPGLRERMWRGLLATALLLAVQIVLGGLTVLALLANWTVTSHLVAGNAFALALVLLGRRLASFAAEVRDASLDARPDQRLVTSATGMLLGIQIVVGGLVSSSYAGLACPDWPTCMSGEYFPTWSGIQGLHLLHRMLGYSVALAIGFAAWIDRSHPGSRRWIGAAAALVVAQVAVGVANVLLRLPVEVTGLHSALAAGLICTVGVSLREVWRRHDVSSARD